MRSSRTCCPAPGVTAARDAGGLAYCSARFVTVLACPHRVTSAPTTTSSGPAKSTGGRVGRSFPVVRLLCYYAALVVIAALLIALVPGFRAALIAPIEPPAAGQ